MATVATDADLVRRYLAGEQRALGDVYERYGDRVYDLCFAMLSSADDAADALQDTFLIAARKLGDLRDPERLRSWLYTIARNQSRARLRARKRTTPDDDVGLDVGVDVDMTADVTRDELRELMSQASAGLNDRDREVLELHMRHELEGEELADVLEVSVQSAYKLVQRVRSRVERSLGSLLVARHARRDCDELDGLLADWDGTFSPLMRKRIGRHVDDCSACSRRRAGLMDPGGLAGAFPIRSAPAELRPRVFDSITAEHAPTFDIAKWDRQGWPSERRRGSKLLLGAVAAGVLFVGTAGGLVLADVTADDEATLGAITSSTSTIDAEPATTTIPPTTTIATADVSEPTTAPPTTTIASTTSAAATTIPTTTDPTSVPTTTDTPRVASPTTTPPTTAPPATTAAPTTAAPTTAAPTTAAPTTAAPTTAAPTTAPPPTAPPPTAPADVTPPRFERLFHTPNNNRAAPLRESPCSPRPGGPPIDTVVTITARTVDDVGVTSVIATWELSTGPAAKVTLISSDGTSWSGSFTIPAGTVSGSTPFTVSARAFDAAGNEGPADSSGGTSFVQPC